MAKKSIKPKTVARIFIVIALLSALVIGIGLGVAIAETLNVVNQENFTDFAPALPTKLLDSEGRIITEFAAEEKRELVSLEDLPKHLIYALLTREDQNFYTHPGFTFRGYFRAFVGIITRQNLGGGSTITLQLAGTLYADRTDISFKRKFVELWWGLQLERRLTKNEILELYMNKVYFGAGCYGVEAASKFYFGHSSREITVAEAAVLVIQLSNPAYYNPLDNPERAKDRSKEVLDQMVAFGYTDKKTIEESFVEYWDNYDYTRVSTSAYFARNDKAPAFSEYVRRQLEQNILYGSIDLNKDGLTVHTTLNLDYQYAADAQMKKGLESANKEFQISSNMRLGESERTYIPIIDLLALTYGLETLHVGEAKLKINAFSRYQTKLNPTIEALSLVFGISELKQATIASNVLMKKENEKTTVEGALITIDNDTGHIVALIGGSKYDNSNQLIRANQGTLMPGSSFKPLYYSAGIDSRKFTEGTMLYDQPTAFPKDDGTSYVPQNYSGLWKGPVLTWYALAYSLNIPALQILQEIGFDAAITRAAKLLDITSQEDITRTFPRNYPLGLGTIATSPLKMARAYAVFANQGKSVTPIAVTSIEDRNGKVIIEPEKELRVQQKNQGQAMQVISPATAAIMVDMLMRVCKNGTLYGRTQAGQKLTYSDETGKKYTIPVGAKTGTTQNWADAWTVGFSPYMTTAVWFGFDRAGNSLGINQTGESVAGNVWADYMQEIHKKLPYRGFEKPQTGLIEVSVCSKSGLIPTSSCNEGTVTLLYLDGTQPKKYCDLHSLSTDINSSLIDTIGNTTGDLTIPPDEGSGLELDPSFFDTTKTDSEILN